MECLGYIILLGDNKWVDVGGIFATPVDGNGGLVYSYRITIIFNHYCKSWSFSGTERIEELESPWCFQSWHVGTQKDTQKALVAFEARSRTSTIFHDQTMPWFGAPQGYYHHKKSLGFKQPLF